MAKSTLPMFARDATTGAMIALPPHWTGFPPTNRSAEPPMFRVLVADDNHADRLLTIGFLGMAWSTEREILVDCVADGAAAWENIQRVRYALVVLDWDMPHRNGGEVLQEMREQGHRVPVVVVSGQRRETVACNLETMTASFVNKDELDPVTLRRAIAASIQLQAGREGV